MAAQASKPKRPPNRTPRPLERQVAKLASAGLPERTIAKVTDLPKTTINGIIHRIFTAEQIQTFKSTEADTLAEKRAMILNTLDLDDIKGMAPRDRAMTYGIFYDKERLERGQSTANVASLHADIAEIKRLKEVDNSVQQANLCGHNPDNIIDA